MYGQILNSIVLTLLLIPSLIFGQDTASVRQSTDAPPDLVKRAAARRTEYIEAFKDLKGEEFQKVEEYDAKGLRRTREVVSDLIIYQSSLNQASVAEYRNVHMVDGKPVEARENRVEKLFARLSKAKSLGQELERIDRESRRFDLNASFSGFTLHQSLPLDPRFSPLFRFTKAGFARIDGHDVIVLDYQQVGPLPGVQSRLSPPRKLSGAEAVYRGRLWLDSDTLRLRRELREWTIVHSSLTDPLIFVRHEFEYSDSSFGILTPSKIVMSAFTRGRDNPDGSSELLLGSKITYAYAPFTRFEVSTAFKPGN